MYELFESILKLLIILYSSKVLEQEIVFQLGFFWVFAFVNTKNIELSTVTALITFGLIYLYNLEI